MLALVNKKNIIIVGLILFIVLLAEPVSAKRAPEKASKSSQNNKQKKQYKKNIDVSKVKKVSKVKRNNNKVSLRSARGKRKSRYSALPKQSNSGRIQQRNFRQPRKISAKPKTNSKVISSSITRSPKKLTRPPSLLRKSFAVRRKALTSSKAPKKVVPVKSGNRKSSNKPVHVARQARRQSPSNSESGKVNIGTTFKTRIDKKIVNNRNRVSKSKTIVINKSKKQPKPKEQNTKRLTKKPSGRKRWVSAILPRPKKKDRIILSTSNDSRKSSPSTRPAFKKRRFTRPIFEKSQRTPREGKKHDRFRPTDSRRRTYRDDNRRNRFGKRRRSRVVFQERDHVVSYNRHHEYIYRDWRNRIHHRIIWPKYRFYVYYNWGDWSTFRYSYPYYHRKYIFVSLNGYWPLGYDYVRYYWYGYHPYNWYGYYPVPREVQGDTYNYYTYNYYGDSDEALVTTQGTNGIQPVDHETFADIREKLAQQASEEPASETEADRLFDEAVKAFEKGDYEEAIEKFAQAMALAPDDIVLPFAYAQTLFANEQYSKAAEVLRTALEKLSPEEEGVFFPRGLYPDEEILLDQIDKLAEKAELYSYDSDLQLLLGYQLLGVGELDAAVEPLHNANRKWLNRTSVEIILGLLEKIKAQEAEGQSQQ